MKRPPFLLSLLVLLASLLGSAAVLHQHSVQTFGAISGLPDPALANRPNPLAVNVALEQYDDAGLSRALASLTAFHWLRQTFPWDQIEPARGEYHWERWDGIVAEAEAHQKEIIAVLDYSPAWARASDADHTGPPLSPTDFAAFASAFAARYSKSVHVYQIWDEPNILLGWGGQAPLAASYAALLQAAYAAIHAADPHATVIAAALAPTVETGPDNLSDLLYLQELYDLGANLYFDAAAGKPYGFYTGPDDRLADPSILNFSRFTLLRQVMVKNGDGAKLLWGGNFGWNIRPEPSPRGQATPEQQVRYTLVAYQRALDEWPWAGPLALENYQPAAPPDDPRWGFALADPAGQPSELLQAINERYSNSNFPAVPGNHLALDTAVHYSGAWEFSDLGADIPENFSSAQIQISFRGADLALKVRRGNYRGYLYVAIDGQPASLLPRDERGAYLVLTSPDLAPQVVTIPVASGLAPDRPHIATLQPERGWDQWAFVGFSVGRRLPDTVYRLTFGLLIVTVLLSAAGVWRFGRGLSWGSFGARLRVVWDRLGAAGQLLLTAFVGGWLYLSTWLAWGDELTHVSRRFGDTWPIVVTALTAGLFYFSPSLLLALVALLALFALFYLRLDLALAFIALFIPFYLFPRMLWERGASMLEFALWLAFAAWLLSHVRPQKSSFCLLPTSVSSLDYALLAFVLVSLASVLTAERRDVAVYEFRTAILGPALFYGLIRATPLDRQAVWRIVDFFLLGAAVIAAIGLYQYATGTNLITAEEGVTRIRSVYGSPNNLALYLGRALPVALAVALMGGKPLFSPSGKTGFSFSPRRALYGLAVLILGITIILTYSKGALFLGMPVALAVILICWLGRRGLILLGAGAAASLAALPLLSRLPRFAGLLNPEGGTSFFRVKLWVSAFRMFWDHPFLGVGPDNFLYQYRSKYILPEAWQDPNLSHPHNIALDYLSRLGLLGLACGVWLQVGFWRAAVETYRRLLPSPGGRGAGGEGERRDLWALSVGLMASVADMLAHGLVDNSFSLIDLAFVFCLTLAVIQHLQKFAEEGGHG